MKNNILPLVIICIGISFTSCNAQRGYRMISEKNGKIGINTKNPDEMLTVKGKIHTQEVIVDLQGAVAPDYVFEKYFEGASVLKEDYNMMSLTDLEAYIKKHQHLPKVPAAKTMEEEGLSLKEMNLLLLEKVEELTLYTIEQQKEIEVLKERLDKLEE